MTTRRSGLKRHTATPDNTKPRYLGPRGGPRATCARCDKAIYLANDAHGRHWRHVEERPSINTLPPPMITTPPASTTDDPIAMFIDEMLTSLSRLEMRVAAGAHVDAARIETSWADVRAARYAWLRRDH